MNFYDKKYRNIVSELIKNNIYYLNWDTFGCGMWMPDIYDHLVKFNYILTIGTLNIFAS